MVLQWSTQQEVRISNLIVNYLLQQKYFLEGIYKRCALLQVQKAHDWSELQCRVRKSAVHLERPAQQATEPRVIEARDEVYSLS